MTERDVAWLSGLFEGEGNIDHRGTGRACMTVAMTDEDVVRRCRSVTGYGTVCGPYNYAKYPDRKPFWRWTVAKCDDVIVLLEAMLPYFGQRRAAKAREVIEAWKVNPLPKRLRTECPNGHPYTAENTVRYLGHRGCKTCNTERMREIRHRDPEHQRELQRARRARARAIAA